MMFSTEQLSHWLFLPSTLSRDLESTALFKVTAAFPGLGLRTGTQVLFCLGMDKSKVAPPFFRMEEARSVQTQS